MNLNKIFKIMILVLPITLTFSCSLPSNKFNKKHVEEFFGKEVDQKKEPSIDSTVNDFNGESEKLKQISTVNFDFNNYSINSKYAKNLNLIAEFLCHYPDKKITIEGHTDNRGTVNYNMNLGEKRALAIKLYLMSKGVSDQQITIISYGPNKPLNIENTDYAYEQNRRAVVIY